MTFCANKCAISGLCISSRCEFHSGDLFINVIRKVTAEVMHPRIVVMNTFTMRSTRPEEVSLAVDRAAAIARAGALFDTARMYTGAIAPLRLDRVFA
jgi:hypothetical protein